MKKSVLLAAGVCLLSGMTAFAEPVTSVNAVGVTKLDLPAGFSMLACPFSAVGGQALSLDEMFGTNNVPHGSYVFLWVPGSPGSYLMYIILDGVWYNFNSGDPSGADKILRGEGFWVYTPTPVSNLSLAGQVPDSVSGTNTVDLTVGYHLLSFAFPQEIPVSQSGLVANEGDYLFKFAGGIYTMYIYLGGGWYDFNSGDGPLDITLKPNEGFWYYSTVANTWTQKKTYTWP
jgi:hypothetical protein